MGMNADRAKAWRERTHYNNKVRKERAILADRKRKNFANERHASQHRSFIAVDGEGGGVNEHGQQLYKLLRAGADRVVHSEHGLSTEDCFDFLLDIPNDRIPVAFAFEYDVTMICRDLPADKVAELCSNNCTQWEQYWIEYIPKQYLKIVRTPANTITGQFSRRHSKNVTVVINDVFGFFQCTFVKALEGWKVGTADQRELIRREKEKRGVFNIMSETEVEYNKLECILLEQLMNKFRETCITTKCIPAQWRGPGWIASEYLTNHKILKTKKLQNILPAATQGNESVELLAAANAAYYGGRFEITRLGHTGPIYAYDINSCYPYAMQFMPCLQHAKWVYYGEDTIHKFKLCPMSLITIRALTYNKCNIGGLPHRDKQGRICFPSQVDGTYWGFEIIAAQACGTIVEIVEAWKCIQTCDCKPFEFVRDLYEYRLNMPEGKDSLPGVNLKLGYNSLYGKLVQSIGKPQWANPIWGSFITAYARKMLLDAASQNPFAIVMLATDGIYSQKPLDLPMSKKLGDWSAEQYEDMLLVQSGIYFTNAEKQPRPKSRGIPISVMSTYKDKFYEVWDNWFRTYQPSDLFGKINSSDLPFVEIRASRFTGMRLANARHKLHTSGVWDNNATRIIKFDMAAKRHTLPFNPDNPYLKSDLLQVVDPQSLPYDKAIGRWRADVAENAMDDDAQPDWLPWGATE